VFFMLSLGLGGLYGGTLMLTDPTGQSLQMSEVLPLLHVPNYILPGLFLLGIMGLTPLVLTYALLARPRWPWAEALCRQGRQYWAWTGTLAVVLIIWLVVQVVLIGLHWPIQYITAGHGVIILLLALTPGVRRFYAT
jgi:hypothetical protein